MKTLQEMEPRLPIDFTNTPGDGTSLFKISSAGSYYLTGSYTVGTGRNFLQITASNVTVDLNGFRIAGQAGSLDGIDALPGTTNIRVCNGSFANLGQAGIDADDSSGVRIEGIGVSGGGADGILLGTGSIVKDCVVTDVAGTGFHLFDGSIADGCVAEACGGDGFVGAGTATIRGCAARSNLVTGIRLLAGATAEGCESAANGQYGVICPFPSDGVRILDNDVVGNLTGGIVVTSNCIVSDNRVTAGGLQSSITATGNGNRVERNSTYAGLYGIIINAGTVDNLVVNNWSHGAQNSPAISVGGANVYGPLITSTGQIATTSPYANFAR